MAFDTGSIFHFRNNAIENFPPFVRYEYRGWFHLYSIMS